MFFHFNSPDILVPSIGLCVISHVDIHFFHLDIRITIDPHFMNLEHVPFQLNHFLKAPGALGAVKSGAFFGRGQIKFA